MPQGLITTIIPVYNTKPSLLTETLDSLGRQTLRPDLLDIIIVDDASTRADTLALLDTLAQDDSYRGIRLSLVRHEQNRWLAQARVTGASRAQTPYLLFLDSDDQVRHDYLKKAVLLLASSPNGGWVYPLTEYFGGQHEQRPPAAFNPYAFFLRNRNPYASVYRRQVWLEASQRERQVINGVRFFEDWDTTIRLMARGHFGVPLADSSFYYNKRPSSLSDRSAKVYLLSIYTTWRANLLKAPLITRSFLRHRRSQRRGRGFPSIINPVRILDRVQRSVLHRALETPDFNAVLDARSVLTGLIAPQRFMRRFMDPEQSITLAEIRCGFVRKPALPPLADESIHGHPDPHAALFAHTWWAIGGAENVLLEWLDAAPLAKIKRLVEITQLSADENRDVRERFGAYTDEQHCLSRIGSNPLERLLYCWNLVCHDRPKLIVISGNAFMYALAPHIKRAFPETVIVDILHNEWHNKIDWFNVAQEYQEQLDYRIVISEHWRDQLISKYGEAPEKIRIHRNFVDTTRFLPPPKEQRGDPPMDVGPHKRSVMFIGRLHEQKNPHVFCEVARLMRDNTEYEFFVVGDGPLECELTESYGHLPNLQFCGRTLEVERYLAHGDVVVFTSRYEGSPLGSLEAAAMNVPIIAPDIIGFREQLCHGQFGISYEPTGDTTMDATRIAGILETRYEELQVCGMAARNHILQHHSRRALKPGQVGRLREFMGYPELVEFPNIISKSAKQLTLHIGWTKTGSTSIQQFMHHNHSKFRAQDVYYPVSNLWGFAHHLVRFYLNPSRNKRQREIILLRFGSEKAFEERMARHINSFVHTPCNHIVVSSEGFFRCGSNSLKAIKQYFSDFSVTVVAYLRRQDEWTEASINQNTKTATGDLQDFNDKAVFNKLIQRKQTKYYSVLKGWAEVFGSENILIAPFEKRNFPDGLQKHFLNLIGVPWSNEFEMVGNKNRRLNRDCVAFAFESPYTNRTHNPKFHDMIEKLETYSAEHPDPPEYKYVLKPEMRLQIIDACRDENARVAREIMGEESGTLFNAPEPSLSDPWEPYPGLSEEKRDAIRQYLREYGVAA